MNTVASPCPGPGLFSRHRNGMSLVVMRFLTLGSTLPIPNQLPKIISTGNAFLTSETKNKKRSTNSLKWWIIYLYYTSLCLGPPHSRLDATNWLRMPRRTFFNGVKVRGALVGDLFSESVFSHYSMKRGSHKRLMRRSEEGWVGRRAGSDELQSKRKTHCFSSTGWEGGNSQLCRHNTAMDVRVGCEVRSCCD